MANAAKWITGGLGFVLGGPIGGVVGFVLGAMIDLASNSAQNDTNDGGGGYATQQTAEGDFKVSLLVLIACVMKADGTAKKQELAVVKQFLSSNFSEQGALEALKILQQLLKQDINETEVARQIGYNMPYPSKLELIHLLFEIAYADGVKSQELIVIQRISNLMGVSRIDFAAIQAPYQRGEDDNWAYTALEIQPSATNEEIKKAYREMAKKYHPDAVANLGEDIKRKATEKFKAINEAYHTLKNGRGFK